MNHIFERIDFPEVEYVDLLSSKYFSYLTAADLTPEEMDLDPFYQDLDMDVTSLVATIKRHATPARESTTAMRDIYRSELGEVISNYLPPRVCHSPDTSEFLFIIKI